LTISIVVVFVTLLLWGFVMGEEAKIPSGASKGIKWAAGIVIILAVIGALIWATGIDSAAFNFLFRQNWSSSFWTNAAFVVVVAIAIALVVRKGKDK
jgi:hypothetical protein